MGGGTRTAPNGFSSTDGSNSSGSQCGSSDYFYLDNINYQNTNPLDGLFVCTVFSTTVTSAGWNWAFLDFDRSEWFNFYNL